MEESFPQKKTAGRRKSGSAAFKSEGAASIFERDLPHNVDAEEGVLASIMRDTSSDVITTCISSKIREDYFFKPITFLSLRTRLSIRQCSRSTTKNAR